MSHQARFIEPSSLSNSDALLVALFVAAVFHAIILVGVRFTSPQPEKINRSIDITLASSPVKRPPKNAKFLAQDNQIGAGDKKQKPEPPKQKMPSQGKGNKKRIKQQTANQKAASERIITTRNKSDFKVNTAKKSEKSQHKKKHKLSPEALKKQIAELGAEIRRHHLSSDLSKVKFVHSVSAHKYVAAQYMKDWQRKVEHTGNMNYPEVARKKGFSGKLTMDVGIKADGSIYSIRINKSSGYKALDDAAIRIVRMSAPFPPLPRELLEELDVLVITRVWKFSDESGMRAR